MILALGEPKERAAEAVRFSLGRGVTAAQIIAWPMRLRGILARIRAA